MFFDKYWGEKPANKGLDFQIFTNSSANLYNSFTTGAVDIAYLTLDSSQILNLKSQASAKNWQVVEEPGGSLSYLVLNVKQKPLDQLEVRQAIASLVDRSLFAQRVYRGQVEPVYSLIPTSVDSYKPVFKDAYGDGNIAKVKELLTKAGFSKNKPFELEIYYASGAADRSQVVWYPQRIYGSETRGDYANQTATSGANHSLFQRCQRTLSKLYSSLDSGFWRRG